MNQDRLPPQDLEAEQATLGAMLMEAGAVTRALGIVGEDDFYREAHREIFAAIRAAYEAGKPVDVVTVGAELRAHNRLMSVGGGEYLTALIGEVPTTAHVMRYATIVHDKAVLRRVAEQGSKMAADAYAQEYEAADLVDANIMRLRDLAGGLQGRDGTQHPSAYATELAARIDEQVEAMPGVYGVRTGIGELDRYLGGLGDYRLCLLLADTGIGKSMVAEQTALASARALRDEGSRRVVLVYVLEAMETWEERALAWLGGIPQTCMTRRGTGMTDRQREAYREAFAEFTAEDFPLFLSDEADVARIELDVERKANQGHLPALVVVDYAQRVQGGQGVSTTELNGDRAERLASIAYRYRCPVLTPSQITDSDHGRHPMWARAWAQEADIMLDMRGDSGKQERSLRCLKSRNPWPYTTLTCYLDTDAETAHVYDEEQWAERQAAERGAHYEPSQAW